MEYASSWQDYSFIGGSSSLSFPTFRKFLAHVHDHFIPHERNHYHPHILSHRFLGLVSLFMVAMKFAIIATVAISPAVPAFSSAITVDNVLALTNQSRQEYKLGALKLNSKLALAAQNKANDMAAKGYFAHNTPDGKTPWSFIKAVGYTYVSAGENLAVDFTQAENVETAWMNSPGHRANILNKNYEEIGIGIANGQFQGHDTIFVVQMFGMPIQENIAFQDKPTQVAVPAQSTPPTQKPAPAQTAAVPQSTPAANAPLAAAAAAAEPAVIQIVDTQIAVQGQKLEVWVTTSGPVAQVMAMFNDQAVMFNPKSETLWQGELPMASVNQDTNLSVQVSDIRGNTQQASLATFSASLPENYNFLGEVKGEAINFFGATLNTEAFENKFYLILIAGLLACMILAIAIRRHVQHLSLVANSSFVVILATLLWMT